MVSTGRPARPNSAAKSLGFLSSRSKGLRFRSGVLGLRFRAWGLGFRKVRGSEDFVRMSMMENEKHMAIV